MVRRVSEWELNILAMASDIIFDIQGVRSLSIEAIKDNYGLYHKDGDNPTTYSMIKAESKEYREEFDEISNTAFMILIVSLGLTSATFIMFVFALIVYTCDLLII